MDGKLYLLGEGLLSYVPSMSEQQGSREETGLSKSGCRKDWLEKGLRDRIFYACPVNGESHCHLENSISRLQSQVDSCRSSPVERKEARLPFLKQGRLCKTLGEVCCGN